MLASSQNRRRGSQQRRAQHDRRSRATLRSRSEEGRDVRAINGPNTPRTNSCPVRSGRSILCPIRRLKSKKAKAGIQGPELTNVEKLETAGVDQVSWHIQADAEITTHRHSPSHRLYANGTRPPTSHGWFELGCCRLLRNELPDFEKPYGFEEQIIENAASCHDAFDKEWFAKRLRLPTTLSSTCSFGMPANGAISAPSAQGIRLLEFALSLQ